MSFADGKFVNADISYTTDVKRGISASKPPFVDILDCIPGQMKMVGHRFNGGKLQHIHYKILQTGTIGPLAMDEVNMFILVTTAVFASHSTNLGMKKHGMMPNGDCLDVTPDITIPHNIATFTAWAALSRTILLDI
jgi:hypothetical protein